MKMADVIETSKYVNNLVVLNSILVFEVIVQLGVIGVEMHLDTVTVFLDDVSMSAL